MLSIEQTSSPAYAAAPAGTPWLRSVAILAVYLLLGAFTLSPLLWTTIPPLVDYPNHLARMAVLLHSGDGSPLASNYVAHWRLLPNLAMDLIVPVLAQFLPLETAGRVFIGLTMALLVIGTATLHRALWGRVSLWPLCALLFVYNVVLWFGFLNYLFSLGVVLLAFSAWVATDAGLSPIRLCVFAAVACVIFVFHLFAFGVYGLLVASYEAGKLRTSRDLTKGSLLSLAAAFLHFVPAGFLWLSAASGPQYTAYGSIGARLLAVAAPALFNQPPVLLDVLVLIIGIAVLPALLMAGTLSLSPAMRLPLIVMLIGAVLMPEYASGSWAAHFRLPVALIFTFIASTRRVASRGRAAILLVSAVFVLLGWRVWAVTEHWRSMESRIAELRGAWQAMPAGIRLLTIQSALPPDVHPAALRRLAEGEGPMSYMHLPTLAVIDRGAFVTSLFTGWTPAEPSERNRGMSRILGGILTPDELLARADSQVSPGDYHWIDQLGEPPCCLDWPQHFDFALWIDFGHPPPTLPQALRPWASGSFFHIYRIVAP
jgi:hypothetical protein